MYTKIGKFSSINTCNQPTDVLFCCWSLSAIYSILHKVSTNISLASINGIYPQNISNPKENVDAMNNRHS